MSAETNENYIFVSYSHFDEYWVVPFIDDLKYNGYNVWYDKQIENGAKWEATLRRKIRNCKLFIALISDDYAISPNCANELDWANERPELVKRIIKNTSDSVTNLITALNNYNDEQFQTWSFENPEKSFAEVQKYPGIQECRKPGYENKPFVFTPVSELTRRAIENIKKNHPSFRMLNKHMSDERLYPKGTTGLNSQESYSSLLQLQEKIRETWKQNKQTHLSVIGIGGIGKTVALLSLFSNKDYLKTLSDTPVIYIPLYVLQTFKSIDDYIGDLFPDRMAKQLIHLATYEWNNYPSIVLLVDGYNEVALMSRPKVEGMIHEWIQHEGVMVISTSRVQFETHQDCFESFTLHVLENKEIKEHLKRYNLAYPTPNILKVIDTPLMLRIYIDVESFMKLTVPEIIEFKSGSNAGTLIYNYLQRELHVLTQISPDIHTKNNDASIVHERSIDIAFSVLCMSPYIAYKMASESLFSITETQFKSWVEEGVSFWKDRLPQQMITIEEYYEQAFYDGDTRWLCSRQRRILTHHEALFVKTKNIYRPVHQNFRDGLAAIHLMHLATVSPNSALEEFKSVISDEVLGYLADLLNDATLSSLWTESKRNFHPLSTKTLIQLNYYKYNHDLKRLDFRNLDLSDINFYRFRDSNNKLLLSEDPMFFANTKLYAKCFLPQEHSDDITCLAVNKENTVLASAGKDHKIMLWNLKTGNPVTDPISTDDHVCKKILFTDNENLLIALNQDSTVFKHDFGQHKSTPITIPTLTITHAVYLSNEHHCVIGFNNGIVGIWDKDTLECIVRSQIVNKPIRNLLISSDRQTILVDCAGTYSVIDKNLNILHEFSFTDATFNQPIAFDDVNHTLILSDGAGQFLPIDYISGMRISSPIRAYATSINSFTFTPTGEYFLTISDNYQPIFWKTDGFTPIEELDDDSISSFFECIKLSTIHEIAFFDSLRAYCDDQINRNNRVYTIDLDELSTIYCCAMNRTRDVIVIGYGHSIGVWNGKDNSFSFKKAIHSDWIRSVAVNAEGTLIVSGSFDETVQLTNIATGETTLLGNHDGCVNSVAINAEGTIAVSGSDDCTVRIWDIPSRTCKHVLDGHSESVSSVGINAEGTQAISASDDSTILVWDVSKGIQIGKFPGFGDPLSAVSTFENSKTAIGILDDEEVFAWNIENDETLPISKGLAFSTSMNRNRIAVLADKHTIKIFDRYFDCIQTVQNPTVDIQCITLNADGTKLVCCSSSSILLYQIKDDLNKRITDEFKHVVSSASLEFLAIQDNSIISNTFNQFDSLQKSEPLALKNIFETPTDIVYDSDSSIYLGTDCGTIMAMNIAQDDTMHVLPGQIIPHNITSLCYDATQKVLIIGTDTGKFYVKDILTGKTIELLKTHNDAIRCIAYHVYKPEEAYIITGSDDNTISIQIASNNTVNTLGEHYICHNPITSLAYEHESNIIAYCTKNNHIHIGSLQSKGFQLSRAIEVEFGIINELLIPSNSKTLVAACNNQIIIWDLTNLDKDGKQLSGSNPIETDTSHSTSLDLSSLNFSLATINDADLQFFKDNNVHLINTNRFGVFRF